MTDTKTKTESLSASEIITERNLPLVQRLAQFGVVAGSYSKPPAGKEVFMVSKGPGVPGMIMLWAGGEGVQIDVKGDADARQALITVTEKARTVRVPVRQQSQYEDRISDAGLRRRWEPTLLRGAEHMHVANEFSRKVTKFTATWTHQNRSWQAWSVEITAVVEIKAKRSEQRLLVGHDEVTQFICALPPTSEARTVKQAHDALRPKGVPKTAKRQGEWFFVPATKDEIAAGREVDGNVVARGYRQAASFGERMGYGVHMGYSRYRIEPNSSHTSLAASTLVIPSNSKISPRAVLVKGVIKDLRTHHHADLDLGDAWHKAVRNTEVISVSALSRPVRRWD